MDSKNRLTEEQTETLRRQFERVQNPHHWKAPINVVVVVRDLSELTEIGAAVIFYTATKATARLHERIGSGWLYNITAPGYWAGPAA